jgi:Fic-DOC domain mobile mystery protein B
VTAGSDFPGGSTPLNPEEAEALIPTHISNQSDLNEWEQANILKGREWAFRRKRRNLLTDVFVKTLHRRMFDETWRWAGTYRTSDKTIGLPWYDVPVNVRNLCADAAYWIEGSVFPLDELAVRVHHRLVQVHPFPNGNGRHARLLADCLLYYLGGDALTWGSRDLQIVSETRDAYIRALKKADAGDFAPLLQFAHS